MLKKITAVLTAVAFFIFSVSCVSHYTKQENIETASSSKKQRMKIVGVQTIAGEYFEFSPKMPAAISGGTISGKAIVEKVLEINKSDIEKHQKKSPMKYSDIIRIKDGTTYEVHSYNETRFIIIITKLYEWTSIPLNRAELVWVQKSRVGVGNIVLAIIVFAAVAAIIDAMAASGSRSMGSSCPFVYSFDGNTYTFDAEPYGGAICQGLERTEWCTLEHIKETSGQYKIRLSNELEETQHTNQVALLVVDHPKNASVFPDISGKIHTIADPVTPDKVFDSLGNDLMPYFAKKDRIFWTTRFEDKNPDRKEDLRDELILEFPKPRGAKTAKLLVNAGTTQWGSHVIKRYLDLYGNTVHDWYNSVKKQGPDYYRFVNMHLKDELYALNIRVQTEKGWVMKGFMRGGGPLIFKDKVYPLDISDVPGDVLKIKLTPPANFWMINHLAVDYSPDFPVDIKQIELTSASDNSGRDVRSILASDDNDYYVMPHTGDQAELIFEPPPHKPGMQRSVILKIKGYYDIHLEAKGKPQLALIERLQKEPGFVVQHAFKEYLKWKNEVMTTYISQCDR